MAVVDVKTPETITDAASGRSNECDLVKVLRHSHSHSHHLTTRAAQIRSAYHWQVDHRAGYHFGKNESFCWDGI